jgi:pectinesterase
MSSFCLKYIYTVPNRKYKKAFLNGLDYLLAAQYENGGCTVYPLKDIIRITFNDDSMVNILEILKSNRRNGLLFQNHRKLLRLALIKELICILKRNTNKTDS